MALAPNLVQAFFVLYEVIMARTGMGYLRDDLRAMTAAGTADYTAGTLTYFSDDYLDVVLDKHVEPFVYECMEAEHPNVVSPGTYQWTVYEIEDRHNIEQTTGGTAIFYIQDQTAAVVATANYSVDYRNGIVTFTADTQGVPYFVTGYAYDLNGAASDIWRMKANNAANSFDFSTDNHSIKRSQVHAQYMAMSDYYRSLSKSGAGGHGCMVRSDTDADD